MQYKRILAVGDIHGMYQKLLSLMDQVQFNPAEDLLVFLGWSFLAIILTGVRNRWNVWTM